MNVTWTWRWLTASDKSRACINFTLIYISSFISVSCSSKLTMGQQVKNSDRSRGCMGSWFSDPTAINVYKRVLLYILSLPIRRWVMLPSRTSRPRRSRMKWMKSATDNVGALFSLDSEGQNVCSENEVHEKLSVAGHAWLTMVSCLIGHVIHRL